MVIGFLAQGPLFPSVPQRILQPDPPQKTLDEET